MDDIGTGGLLDRFVASLAPLGSRRGAILVQFPATRARERGTLEQILAVFTAHSVPVAFEFRHESWDDPGVARAAADAGATRCLADVDGEPPGALPPGPIAYVRMRADRYTPSQRDDWLALLRSEASERPVYAFTKHEGTPPDDPLSGVGLARWLAEAGNDS